MTEENILNHYTWSLLIYWALVFLIQWLNSVIKNLWGFFSLIFNCSVGIILRLARLVVMEWLPVAVGAVCTFIYMQWRSQAGFQEPSLNTRKLSQNLPPNSWVSLIWLRTVHPWASHWQKVYGINLRPIGSTGAGRRILFLWGTWGIYGGRKDNF